MVLSIQPFPPHLPCFPNPEPPSPPHRAPVLRLCLRARSFPTAAPCPRTCLFLQFARRPTIRFPASSFGYRISVRLAHGGENRAPSLPPSLSRPRSIRGRRGPNGRRKNDDGMGRGDHLHLPRVCNSSFLLSHFLRRRVAPVEARGRVKHARRAPARASMIVAGDRARRKWKPCFSSSPVNSPAPPSAVPPRREDPSVDSRETRTTTEKSSLSHF